MKRAGGLLEGILRWDNLLLAFCRAERGLSEKYEADIYRLNLNDNLGFLRDGLEYGNFPFGEYHSFEERPLSALQNARSKLSHRKNSLQ